LNFEDEDYRRLYVRRTVTSKRLGWEGRAVRNEMLTEFDRAGVWEFTDDAAADIADLVDLPLEVVQAGLTRLLATKTWVMGDGKIVWPSYVEGQNCVRSDRLRQQESRDRRRAEALSDQKTSQVDQSRHAPSRPSQVSRNVTPPSLPSYPSLPPEPEEKSSPVRKLAWFVPDDWAPKDTHRVRCQELRFGLDELVAGFRRHEFNRQYSDWDRRFEAWIEKEKLDRETAAAAKRVPGLRNVTPGADLETTSAATAFAATTDHKAFCAHHQLDLAFAVKLYRQGSRPAALGTVHAWDDFANRLKCWAATGTFHPDGPLPKAPRKEVRAS
jgi:hypothetical protein